MSVFGRIAGFLRALGGAVYKQYLFLKIQSSDYDRRFDAIYAVKEKFGVSAVPGLIYILQHKDPEIRHDVAYALELITGAYNGDSYARWKKWWEKNRKRIKKEAARSGRG